MAVPPWKHTATAHPAPAPKWSPREAASESLHSPRPPQAKPFPTPIIHPASHESICSRGSTIQASSLHPSIPPCPSSGRPDVHARQRQGPDDEGGAEAAERRSPHI